MSEPKRDLLTDVALALLALPILIVRGLLRLRRLLEQADIARRGALPCRWCGALIPTARMATCPACGWTTPGSLFSCRCGATFSTVVCPTCGGTNGLP